MLDSRRLWLIIILLALFVIFMMYAIERPPIRRPSPGAPPEQRAPMGVPNGPVPRNGTGTPGLEIEGPVTPIPGP